MGVSEEETPGFWLDLRSIPGRTDIGRAIPASMRDMRDTVQILAHDRALTRLTILPCIAGLCDPGPSDRSVGLDVSFVGMLVHDLVVLS